MTAALVKSDQRRAARNLRSAPGCSIDILSHPAVTPAEPDHEAATVADPLQLLATVARTLQALDTKRVLPKPALRQFFDRFMSLRQGLESGTADPEAWMEKFETACDELTQATEEAQALAALDTALFDATAELENNAEILRRKFYQLTGAID